MIARMEDASNEAGCPLGRCGSPEPDTERACHKERDIASLRGVAPQTLRM